MRRAEVIRVIREDYLDDVSDNPDQSDEEYLWSKSFLERAVAEAEMEACRRTDLIFDDSTASITEITLVAATSSYPLSSKITRIEAVIYNDDVLEHTTAEALEDENGKEWRADTGPPTHYVIKGRNIRVYPIPTATEIAVSDTLNLEAYRLPLISFSATFEIPEEYHEKLCSYAAYKAYKRRDEETYDPNKAAEMLTEFNSVFGEPPDARVREHQLRSPKDWHPRFDYGYSDNRRNNDADEDW